MARVLLFSDVDGTLLDEAGHYAISAEQLAPYCQTIDVVLASSRTILELSRNQRDLGLAGPVVAENGAVVAVPWHDALVSMGTRERIDEREWCVLVVGDEASLIRDKVRETAFSLGVLYIDQTDVESTLGRRASVLLRPVHGQMWEHLEPLAKSLRHQGFSVASGGTWLAVTRGADKGVGARTLMAVLALLQSPPDVVAGVGDGDNDVALLAIAKERFVISSHDGSWHPALMALPNVTRVSTPGIAGWLDVLHAFVDEEKRIW